VIDAQRLRDAPGVAQSVHASSTDVEATRRHGACSAVLWRPTMQTKTGLIVIGAAVAGIAATTNYVPRDATGWNDQYRSVTIAVPAEAPRGTVELSSFGKVRLAVEGGQSLDALHVRMVIANAGDLAPWTIDLPGTTLKAPGSPSHRAVAANSNIETLPAVVVGTGEVRTLDIYFPMPAGADSFEIAWRVTTPTSEVRERTQFTRQVSEGSTTLPTGWGSHWWFDPEYPWHTYFHRDGIIVPRPPESATVTRGAVRHDDGEVANPCDQR
jgi:hypothetical protein